MKFDTLIFFLFFFITIVVYFKFSKNVKNQNIILLFASIIFYATWDSLFVLILLYNILVGYFFGLFSNKKKTNYILNIGIILLLIPLLYYKYLNFILLNLAFFLKIEDYYITTNNFILPLGISFYTFHGLSYLLDLKNKRIPIEKSLLDYSIFISYFPLLLAGPIERTNTLLPQIKKQREFNYSRSVTGTRLILFGLWKKVFVANSLAFFSDKIFNDFANQYSFYIFICVIGFMFQVYADFSAYSDIARGCSRILGIELIRNFNFPFFAKSIPEYWSRWHISLSSWLNDYIFSPIAIATRHFGKFGILLSIFITFLVSGVWHGASWNYIFWGLIFALSYLPYVIFQSKISFTKLKSSKNIFLIFLNIFYLQFVLFLTYLFFRSPNLNTSFLLMSKLISFDFTVDTNLFSKLEILFFFFQVGFFILVDYSIFTKNYFYNSFFKNKLFRNSLYVIMSLVILLFINRTNTQFIYFQF